jgi:hypothetical protein
MTPLGNGSFKMTGLYAEVFTALKASILKKSLYIYLSFGVDRKL